MIKSLRLLNWRSHADSTLSFRQGTNLLVGIMGAGKSSVLEAISFALYGTFPAIERRKMKLENAIRLNESKAQVILEFQWDGDAYRIERTVERSKKGTSSGAELYRNGSLLEHGQTAVTEHVTSLVGADYDLFTRAIYSEQNNIDHFLNLDPSDRKKEMDSLLGLDRFELARASCINVLNKLRTRRSAFEERFSRPRMTELEEKGKQLSESHASFLSTLASLSESESALSIELEALSAKFGEMKKEKEKWDSLERDCIRLSAMVESLTRELEGRSADEARPAEIEKALSDLNSKKAQLQNEIAPGERRLAEISKETGSLEQMIRTAESNARKALSFRKEMEELSGGKSAEELQLAQGSLEKEVLGMESELHSLRKEEKDVSELLPRLAGGLLSCPLCSSPLGPEGLSHVKAEKESVLSRARARISEIGSALALKKKEAEGISGRARKLMLLSEKNASLEKEAATGPLLERKKALEGSASELGGVRKAALASLEKITTDSEALRLEMLRLKETNSKHRQLAEAKAKMEALKAESRAAVFSAEAFEGLRQNLEALRLRKEKNLSEKRALQSQIKMSGDALSSVKGELDSLRSLEASIRDIYSMEEQLSAYRQALLETQTGLRSEMSEAINSAMNEIWSIFYPYRNYHGLRLLVSEKDYVFEVNDGGLWKGIESVASGGERACAALALRMSLAMVLTPRIGWLILDEPTHNLDSEAVETLSHALAFKVPQVVRQTFVITHDESFMGSDFASSLRLSRDKNNNGETKVEPQ